MLTQWHNGAMHPPGDATHPSARRFKNKTIATLLASLGGTLGLHRFYLHGPSGWLPWLYPLFSMTLIPTYIGFVEAIVFALTPDEKWDARHNAGSGQQYDTGWPVPLMLVLGLALGATALIAAIARTFDILLTGGSYG